MGGSGSFSIPRCGDVAYINFFKRLQLQGSNYVSGKVPPSWSLGEIINNRIYYICFAPFILGSQSAF